LLPGPVLFTMVLMSTPQKSKSSSRSEKPPFPRQKIRKTRQIRVGNIPIGGGAPISVQSMTKSDTRDRETTLAQVHSLNAVGCEIVRLAVPDEEALESLLWIKKESCIPIVADIHFDHKLALGALEGGIDGLRINPGNIGSAVKVREVVASAKDKMIPIRIGVNSGSLEKELMEKYGEATPAAMVESALRHIRLLEDLEFYDIKVSLKDSDITRTLEAYRLLASDVDYPFHAGITEAGSLIPGTVKSSIGLAFLIQEGLADTIRVSLTAPPEEEVRVAYHILNNLGIRRRGLNIIS
jgi:(E)-4-hydroxy-3-methylbut-2-enyl-diphosphate synthase